MHIFVFYTAILYHSCEFSIQMEKEQNQKQGNNNSIINHKSNGFQSEHDNSSFARDKIMEMNLDKKSI